MVSKTSGSGERNARLGLAYQDRASAVLIYHAILEGTLSFIALADDMAGMFDDLVIGIAGRVVGHQYKSSQKPQAVGIVGLLLGSEQVIADCAASFVSLEQQFPDKVVRLRYVSSHFPSVHDRGKFGIPEHDSADFIAEKARCPDRGLTEWRATIWHPLIAQLQATTELDDDTFERFFTRFDIVLGAPATIADNPALDAAARDQIEELSRAIGRLITDHHGKTRWSRRELLDELGWADRFRQRFEHRFPLGAHIQSNEITEAALTRALAANNDGYLCLLGSPGTGKSTLLERFVQPRPGRCVVRYLAYVPGAAQGQGRGDAASFLSDLNSQLSSSGLEAKRIHDETLQQRRETFESLLRLAGKRFAADGIRTIIIVDGLDHIPREEKPEVSLLGVLPLPQSVPDGVVFVLGSQRIDLADIPPAVRDQAALPSRKIEIAPLSKPAVTAMVRSAELPSDVDPLAVYEVSGGHPLVTQYLLGKLSTADEAESRRLLDGGFEYDGDLEAVYRKAWREALEAGDPAAKVLLTLGYVEGEIEPELLACAMSRSAVDSAYRKAHHLLDHSGAAWRVFHNSFRLFLRRQSIPLYGKVDPEYAEPAIYERLADLAGSAGPQSAQRWLEFRYRFLAGALTAAAALAHRGYFIDQFIDGRVSHDVNNDVSDAVACLGIDPPADRLFELMVTKDEVWRRQDCLDTAQRLIEAQIAVGDLDGAIAQLKSNHLEGDQWRVVEALLKQGFPDRARAIFDSEDPWVHYDKGHGSDDDFVETWADYAVVLLDDEQIERRIRKPKYVPDGDDRFASRTPKEFEGDLRFALANAILRRDPDRQVDEVARVHGIPVGKRAILRLKAAEARLAASRNDAARTELEAFWHEEGGRDLRPTWNLHAVDLSLASDSAALAGVIFDGLPKPSLCGLELNSGQVADAVRHLVRYCEIGARLGRKPPEPALPSELGFRGVQHHAIELGTLIGELKADRLVAEAVVRAKITLALKFQAGVSGGRDEDPLLTYRLRYADAPIMEAIAKIIEIVPELAPGVQATFDSCLDAPRCGLRDAYAVRCRFSVTMFEITGDRTAAIAELGGIGAVVEEAQSPHEAIDSLSDLAMAYAAIGEMETGRALMRKMRETALGTYSPAKRDGQYHTWADMLVAANREDPKRAADRSRMMLRLVQGVNDSAGNDQAARISKEVLVEAVASGPDLAYDAYQFAMSSGIWRWDAIVDAIARGILRRRPELARVLAICWKTLCLPYYGEVYHSVTELGLFLSELASRAPADQLSDIEVVIVDGLEADAKPTDRLDLLKIFRAALHDRQAPIARVSVAIARWSAEVSGGDVDPFLITTLDGLEAVAAAEHARREAEPNTYYGSYVSTALGKRAAQIVETFDWPAIKEFAQRSPQLVQDEPVKHAIAKAALAANDLGYARELLLTEELAQSEGWGGWGGGRRRDYHRARHLLGEKDAHEAARRAFVRDFITGGVSTGSALWDIETLFPLIYREIDWPALWDRLAETITASRDYLKVQPVASTAEPIDDVAMLARLFVDAMNLGVSDPRRQVKIGLLEAVEAGAINLFASACDALLANDGVAALASARLLYAAREQEAVKAAFKTKLKALTDSEDVCIAIIGQVLSYLWEGDASIEERELPAIYQFHLPELDRIEDRSLRDQSSYGPIVDDPAAWTEWFEPWIVDLSKRAEVPVANIRHRVAQLIGQWGGAAQHGDKATKALERKLRPLGMLMPFPRPHMEVAMRALRVVIGELWRAAQISDLDVELMLYRLTGSPILPPPLAIEPRPAEIVWPTLADDLWHASSEKWLQAGDLTREWRSDLIIGEWVRFSYFEHSVLFNEETLLLRSAIETPVENLDAALRSLPALYWHQGRIGMFDDRESRFCGLRRLQITVADDPPDVLMFDPLLARRLGWHSSQDEPYAYRDEHGELMVSTVFWRDGWLQECQFADEMRWGEGQRVCLTQRGLAEFTRNSSLPATTVTRRWRSYEPSRQRPTETCTWTSQQSETAI